MLDLKNLPCPEPVIRVKKALEEIGENAILDVVVNSYSSKENILRYAKNSGCESQVEPLGNEEWKITIVKGFACEIAPKQSEKLIDKVLFIKDDKVGEGELGERLMTGFLEALKNQEKLPRKMIFVNRGVLLTSSEEQKIIETLKAIEDFGVEIYSCGVCLGHFNKSPKVGKIGNAYETVEALISSGTITF